MFSYIFTNTLDQLQNINKYLSSSINLSNQFLPMPHVAMKQQPTMINPFFQLPLWLGKFDVMLETINYANVLSQLQMYKNINKEFARLFGMPAVYTNEIFINPYIKFVNNYYQQKLMKNIDSTIKAYWPFASFYKN